jgi:hypothetical protein
VRRDVIIPGFDPAPAHLYFATQFANSTLSTTFIHQNILTMARSSDVLLIIIAIIFPPAAVAFISGCSCDLAINLL